MKADNRNERRERKRKTDDWQVLSELAVQYQAGSLTGRYAVIGALVDLGRDIKRSRRLSRSFMRALKKRNVSSSDLATALIAAACNGIQRSNRSRYAAILKTAWRINLDGKETSRRLKLRGVAGFIEAGGKPEPRPGKKLLRNEIVMAAMKTGVQSPKAVMPISVPKSKRKWLILMARSTRNGLAMYDVVHVSKRDMAKIARKFSKRLRAGPSET